MDRYIVSFVPIGSNNGLESKDIVLYLDSDNIDDIKSEAYKVAQNHIDPFH
jgi:hypothetical protein